MARIVRFSETGGPEGLQIMEEEPAQPGPGEIRINVESIGLNRAEVMFCSGVYLEAPEFPSRLGYEAAGRVDAIGNGVEGISVGNKVSTLPAFSIGAYGAYGDSAIVPTQSALHYPENLFPCPQHRAS